MPHDKPGSSAVEPGEEKCKVSEPIFTESAPLGGFSYRVAMSMCASAPLGAVFYEAFHWPSGHMISSRPLIGPPSLPPIYLVLCVVVVVLSDYWWFL